MPCSSAAAANTLRSTTRGKRDLNVGGSQISLVAWAKSGQPQWNSSDSFIESSSYSLGGVASSKNVEFRLKLGGTWNTLTYTNPNGVGSWAQYAGTYDGSTMRLYVNGALATSMSASGTISGISGPLYLAQNGASGYLKGSLDEVQIYNANLPADDIASLYNQVALNVTSLTPTNSSSSSSYHVQSFDFGFSGVNQYGDQSGSFSAPGQFLGSTFIQTANADNLSTTFSLSFTVNTPSTVYILFDNAITTKPTWLTQQFASTGQTIANSAGHTFMVYQAVYMPGDTITLGANDGNANSQMYSVLFAPLAWYSADTLGDVDPNARQRRLRPLLQPIR